MQWENLTAPQFVKAVETCEGVCLLPIGVFEKHGSHLPLGTDVILAREIARRAAEREPALVFPAYFFTQIFEARHVPGAIGLSSKVMIDLLESTCAEIARNGLKKIILFNTHGGNRHFLPHFITLQLERPKDYVLYLPNLEAWFADAEFSRRWDEISESKIRNEHAGEAETSLMLAIAPTLVDTSGLPDDQGAALNRLSGLEAESIYNVIGWYANFPHHYSGQGEYGTAAKGEFVLNYLVDRLVKTIQLVKADAGSAALQREFFEQLVRGPVQD